MWVGFFRVLGVCWPSLKNRAGCPFFEETPMLQAQLANAELKSTSLLKEKWGIIAVISVAILTIFPPMSDLALRLIRENIEKHER